MSVHSRIELEFGNVGFKERGKLEYSEKNLSEQSTEPTTNSNHIQYDAGFGNGTQVTLVGGKRSHHCTNPAPLICKKTGVNLWKL